MAGVKNSLFQSYKGFAEMFVPVLKDSKFLSEGKLTPGEFVLAGDLLVQKCPTWQWKGSDDPAKKNSSLPDLKQYLITTRVPCAVRANSLNVDGGEKEADDGWVETHTDMKTVDEEVKDMTVAAANMNLNEGTAGEEEDDDDDIPDMEDCIGEEPLVDGGAVERKAETIKTRTYDLHITYDKYYSTPHVWLFGYSEEGSPLTGDEMFEDIYSDYSNKTATIENHPFKAQPHMSIHPCRHAETMKRMVDRILSRGEEEGGAESEDQQLSPCCYLLIFLKFIGAVIPTIQYDFTTEVEL